MIRNIFGPAGKVAHFLVFVLIAVVETDVVAWLPIPGIVDLPLTEDLADKKCAGGKVCNGRNFPLPAGACLG
jgi:hypothetical protein